ncbi:MAG TPA: DUF1573 domain-containing protein [Candidatus Hydrogenedens sp.]|nr:DUF1573 domain-containing protein [Candidatus Hydrogenedens sp.]
MRRTQYLIFGIVFLCSIFVLWLVFKSQNQDIERKAIEEPYLPSLPPMGSSQENTASIELESGPIFDMGTVPNDKETTKKLKVFNKGKTTLSLKDIRSSCACTQGTIPINQNAIPPGGEGYILITIHPSRVAGFYSEKTLTIFSNDFKNPSLELKVRAHIEPEFICEPEEVSFGSFQKGTIAEQKIHITQKNMKKPLEISKVYEMNIPDNIENDLSTEIVKIKVDEPVEYLLTVKVGPNISPGEFIREIFLSTNIDRFPEVPIRIKGTVVAPYKIIPAFPKPFISFPSPTPDITNIKTIEIVPQFETEKVELVSYKVVPDVFTASVISDEGSSKIKIIAIPKTTEKDLTAVLELNIRVNETKYLDHVLLKTMFLKN